MDVDLRLMTVNAPLLSTAWCSTGYFEARLRRYTLGTYWIDNNGHGRLINDITLI